MTFEAIFKNTMEYSMFFVAEALPMRENSLKEENGCQGLGARAHFLAQVIASIAAIPLLFLGTLLLAPFALCLGEEGDTWNVLKSGAQLELVHLSLIPTCLIAAFAPHSYEWEQPTEATFKCIG